MAQTFRALEKIYEHPVLGKIILRQRWSTRRISISIKPTGEIHLSFPRLVSTAKAIHFLEEKRSWIEATRPRIAERTMAGGELSKEQIEVLRSKAKRTLPAMVERLAHIHGFSYGRITIRASRSKWGCCTSKNNLSLSLFLVMLPQHLQEFVVLHELCHTVHHNHSAAFHELLNRVTNGCEKELNRQIKGIRKNLHFRRGGIGDIETIMKLVAEAQQWFASQGIDQWQDGYPTQEIIENDIIKGYNYIVEYNGSIVATSSISFDGEPTYNSLVRGGWLNENDYAVVHRIMVANSMKRKGVAQEILAFTEGLCAKRGVSDIRIDTHRDNVAMRRMLKRMGYSHRGVITLTSGASREAYHKLVSTSAPIPIEE